MDIEGRVVMGTNTAAVRLAEKILQRCMTTYPELPASYEVMDREDALEVLVHYAPERLIKYAILRK